jgi:predicted Zn-dependent protease
MSLRGILAATFLLLVVGCAPQPPAVTPELPVDVYLVPVDDFPFEFTDRLARQLSTDLNLRVRASLPMGIGDIRPLPKHSQLAAEDIIERAHEVGLRLLDADERRVVVALTTRDINDRSQSLRFLFASTNKATHTSVISVARMLASTPKVEGTQAQAGLRIYKMVKRAIGEQYFGLPRSADISDIMYAPIMSLEDIDAMGTDYRR